LKNKTKKQSGSTVRKVHYTKRKIVETSTGATLARRSVYNHMPTQSHHYPTSAQRQSKLYFYEFSIKMQHMNHINSNFATINKSPTARSLGGAILNSLG
jgi:hypothetical protein